MGWRVWVWIGFPVDGVEGTQQVAGSELGAQRLLQRGLCEQRTAAKMVKPRASDDLNLLRVLAKLAYAPRRHRPECR